MNRKKLGENMNGLIKYYMGLILLVLVIAIVTYVAIIVNGLSNPPLFDNIEPSSLPIARESYYESAYGHATVRAGAPGYIPYNPNRPDASSEFFAAAMVDKEGWKDSLWVGIFYFENDYYSQSRIYKPWNDFYVWVKWNYTDMDYDDLYQFGNDGWILKNTQVGSNGYQYSYSVTVNGGPISGSVTISMTSVDGAESSSSNSLDNGWLYLGHAKVWRADNDYSFDEYTSKAIMKIIADNSYLEQHDGKALLIKVKVVAWWWYVGWWVNVLNPAQGGSESYYWGVVYWFTLGDRINAEPGDGNHDCYIVVAPGSYNDNTNS